MLTRAVLEVLPEHVLGRLQCNGGLETAATLAGTCVTKA